MPIEELLVGLARALQVAEALAKDAEVEQRGIEFRIEVERVREPGDGFVRLAERVERERIVIRGRGAERRVCIAVNLFQLGRGVGVLRQLQQRDRAIETRLGERQRFLEQRQCALRIAAHHQREAAQIVELRLRRAGRFDAAELLPYAEEQTSELQSRQYLLCSLLLEKK